MLWVVAAKMSLRGGGINIFEQRWVSFNLTHYLLKHYCLALWQSNEVISEDDYECQDYKTPPTCHFTVAREFNIPCLAMVPEVIYLNPFRMGSCNLCCCKQASHQAERRLSCVIISVI